jgi:hypothetical protein
LIPPRRLASLLTSILVPIVIHLIPWHKMHCNSYLSEDSIRAPASAVEACLRRVSCSLYSWSYVTPSQSLRTTTHSEISSVFTCRKEIAHLVVIDWSNSGLCGMIQSSMYTPRSHHRHKP